MGKAPGQTTLGAYKVTFDIGGKGTAPASVDVEEGGKVTAPAEPTASGFKFAGWYKGEDLTDEWDFDNDTVTEDITLYAKWLNLVGGTIFFIDSAAGTETVSGNASGEVTVGGVKYTFCDENLEPVDLDGKSYKRNDAFDDITDTLTEPTLRRPMASASMTE